MRGQRFGLGLAAHIVNFSRLVWPWFAWQRWALLLLNELVRPRHRLGVFGPSSSGKSCPVGLTYLTLYLARPENTTVLVSSTTRDELDLRIWGEIVMLWKEARDQFDWIPGHLTDSKQMITTDGKEVEGRDRRNGVLGRPCKIGNKWLIGSGTSPFVGIKNDHVYLAADEAGLMPPGFLEALANLTSNPSCCAAVLGNLGDLDTPLGQVCEPALGWDSLPDSEKSRVFDTRWHNGRAVQFIGTDSPNIDYPADAEPYPKLIGRRYLKQCAEDYGLDTPLYNMFAAGKIPRGTMANRVLTEADCERNDAFEPVIWGHEPLKSLYCLDVSYTAEHGDRTVGRPIDFGQTSSGQQCLAPRERPLVYTPSDRSDLSITDQLAYQCLAELKRLDIPPAHLFFDGTGRSEFTASAMRIIGTSINPIEFGGTATKRPNFINRRYEEDRSSQQKKGDLLPCDEVFDRMVTELWFALQALVISKQARNLDRETIKETSRRLWKLTAGNRISVEPKKELKLRTGRSPDAADNLVVGIEGARRLGFPLGSLDATVKRSQSRWLSRLNRDYQEARQAVELAA